MEHRAMNTEQQDLDITRWECVQRIRDKDWRMRVVVADGFAWCSFGRVGGPKHQFMQHQADDLTPDLCNLFRRAVVRAVQHL